ncbi:DUF4159 domain-containing protein [Notoacmeibacter sp. MSK16QG-6]|uniref:DUF4159 domain-containing protein n=1 Tax=Notoacmeibacter sp. MSK16QG-6 TaxID=2957982 RepID=UPI00209EF240|nr:DUF4159 domain-containing protein [Notoacmeibacter sp. MSK16QG-6]MCP1199898.1 DUF4159 domain-containing protein [Notoacmeibacter sp. MSK16QG-6]
MFGLPLAFTAPALLAGLATLPVIWWLLRATPPRPKEEVFPPLRILARVLKTEETPQKSPWWLTALRLLIAAFVILALAGPLWNPRPPVISNSGPLVLAIDNGWASAQDWEERATTAGDLIDEAAKAERPIFLAFTADPANSEVGPFNEEDARQRLAAATPHPVPVNRQATFERLATTAGETGEAMSFVLLSDGLASKDDAGAFAVIGSAGATRLVLGKPDRLPSVVATAAENEADALVVILRRPDEDNGPALMAVGAYDSRGRRIAETEALFAASEMETQASFAVPFELRNDIVRIAVDGAEQAGAVRLLDDDARRRRVGLVGGRGADAGSQPLLAPLFYIRRALAPFADLVEPSSGDLSEAVPAVLEQKPAMIVLADVGVLPETVERELLRWVRNGGMLVRFAGPRLAGTDPSADRLLPVTLRSGERALGGALSFTEPQPVADFPADGPFANLIAPREVKVERQVLAQPSPELAARSWATLDDGTPLVTGRTEGEGTLVLFHITPEASWSNLPLSGSFVDMLRQLTRLSRNQGRLDAGADTAQAAAIPPWRILDAGGALVAPGPEARPLEPGEESVTLANPPGLYGNEEAVFALNLMAADATLEPIETPVITGDVQQIGYGAGEQVDLRGPLFALALALLAIDTLVNLWLAGALSSLRRNRRMAGHAAASLTLALAVALIAPSPLLAQEPSQPSSNNASEIADADAVEALTRTRLAYVLTGDAETDRISRAGMRGLSAWLIGRTAMEPGEPRGVDIESDELAFYPLLYWPVVANTETPSAATLARIDVYMTNGGTVLFDTKDEFSQNLRRSGTLTPATRKLREILATLNVPPLEPVPTDHVLTKSFYILPSFPGRYANGPLWVEAVTAADGNASRPVRRADGVSPILITSNDLAGAWAISDEGRPLLPVVPGGERQREYAYRVGTNIMMYMLTGNYKADQVHVPTLLERLGQ